MKVALDIKVNGKTWTRMSEWPTLAAASYHAAHAETLFRKANIPASFEAREVVPHD